MEAYRTFWQRFFAGCVDTVVFVPLFLLHGVVDPASRGALFVVFWEASTWTLIIGYGVLMHARYGQTLGKMALGVIVLDVTESRRPTLKQAALRDIGNIVPALVVIGFLTAAVVDAAAVEPPLAALDALLRSATWVWFVIELLTMLLSRKRRALHDFIAGTVVMKREAALI